MEDNINPKLDNGIVSNKINHFKEKYLDNISSNDYSTLFNEFEHKFFDEIEYEGELEEIDKFSFSSK